MTQAANRQWLGGKDREGALHVLGQNIWGRSAPEPLPTSHRLRVSPGPPGSILGAGVAGTLWTLVCHSRVA